MVNRSVAESRLAALERYLLRLVRFSAIDRQAFVSEEDTHALAERYLHLAMECVLDLANHVIADRGLELPVSMADSFRVLERTHLLTASLSTRLQKLAGMRNVLVHEYLGIDHGLTYDAIASRLPDLKRFAAVVVGLLGEDPKA